MDPLSSRHDSHGAPVAAKAGMPQGNLYPYYTFLNRGSLQSKVAILGRKQWGFRCHLIISCFQRSLTTFRLICCVRIQNIYTNYPPGLRRFVNINTLASLPVLLLHFSEPSCRFLQLFDILCGWFCFWLIHSVLASVACNIRLLSTAAEF